MQENERKPLIGITGATGTLGRALVGHLAGAGYRPRCLVRPGSHDDQVLRQRADVVVGNIADPGALRELVVESDACIHLAAYVGHGTPADYHAINVEGTRLLCEAILAHAPACRLVYCSTIAALRIRKRLPMLATPYARSKQRATETVREYQRSRALKAAIVYPGLIYGPGEEKLVAGVIARLKSRRIFLVRGGERDAPLIYIDDLCELLLLAATRPAALGEEYVAVNGHPAGVHDFIRQVARRTGAEAPRLVLPKGLMLALAVALEFGYRLVGSQCAPPLSRRIVDILSIRCPQLSPQANAALGWRPRVGAEEGLGLTLAWLAGRDCHTRRIGAAAQPT